MLLIITRAHQHFIDMVAVVEKSTVETRSNLIKHYLADDNVRDLNKFIQLLDEHDAALTRENDITLIHEIFVTKTRVINFNECKLNDGKK